MPLYEYLCACGWTQERLERMPGSPSMPCPCGGTAERVLSRPAAVMPELTPYYDDGLGVRVESRKQKRQYMKDRHLLEAG